MKKQSIIAMALILTLLTGCFKNYDEVDVSVADVSETTSGSVSDTVETSDESEHEHEHRAPYVAGSILAPVELDAWKMTIEKENDHQQKIFFEKEGNKFVGRLVLPEGASEKLPTVVLLDFNPTLPNNFAFNKGTVEGITTNGMACLFIEAFGSGDSTGTYESLSFDNVNEMLTVVFGNMDKIAGVDSSNAVLWVNSQAQLFALYAMQDKCDRVKAIFIPGAYFTDGASIREVYPDKEKIPRDGAYDFFVDQMYDIDAKDFFPNVSCKVYAITPEIEDNDSIDFFNQYMNYFPDKVFEQAGKNPDFEKGVYKGQGVIFDKILEDLKTVFGI